MTGPARPITLANDPLAPYFIAPGWQVGDLLFLSGQASIGPDGSIVGEGDFDAQLAQTFANIETVLAAAGSDLSKVVKVTIYLTDMATSPRLSRRGSGTSLRHTRPTPHSRSRASRCPS